MKYKIVMRKSLKIQSFNTLKSYYHVKEIILQIKTKNKNTNYSFTKNDLFLFLSVAKLLFLSLATLCCPKRKERESEREISMLFFSFVRTSRLALNNCKAHSNELIGQDTHANISSPWWDKSLQCKSLPNASAKTLKGNHNLQVSLKWHNITSFYLLVSLVIKLSQLTLSSCRPICTL